MSHLMDYIIFSNAQFGFHKNYSTEPHLIQMAHDLALNLNKKGQTDVTLLDFSKGFDNVPYHYLTLKLQYYGIRGNT